jgi:hypothetical protein
MSGNNLVRSDTYAAVPLLRAETPLEYSEYSGPRACLLPTGSQGHQSTNPPRCHAPAAGDRRSSQAFPIPAAQCQPAGIAPPGGRAPCDRGIGSDTARARPWEGLEAPPSGWLGRRQPLPTGVPGAALGRVGRVPVPDLPLRGVRAGTVMAGRLAGEAQPVRTATAGPIARSRSLSSMPVCSSVQSITQASRNVSS